MSILETTLISFPDLRARFGLTASRTTIWRMCRDGRLPSPFKSSTSRTGRLFWRLSEVEAAISRWPKTVAKPGTEVAP